MRAFQSAALMLFSFTCLCADTLDIQSISKKIDMLKESRNIPAAIDYKVYDPFLKAKPLLAQKEEKPAVTTQRILFVQTILNNKALIEGRWFGVGDHIDDATITAIHNNHIIISKGNKKLTIFLKAKKSIITTKDRSQ